MAIDRAVPAASHRVPATEAVHLAIGLAHPDMDHPHPEGWQEGEHDHPPDLPLSPGAAAAPTGPPVRTGSYQETLILIGRLHCELLNVISDELERRGEAALTGAQALLLFNVGDRVLTPSQLRGRRCFLGSNVSYTLKKLVESGYLNRQRSDQDRRSALVRLTPKGAHIRNILSGLFNRHTGSLEVVANLATPELDGLNFSLRNVGRFLIK